MISMTTLQFTSYIKSHQIHSLSFNLDDQPWDTVGNPLNIRMRFTNFAATANPNWVGLSDSNNNMLYLENVDRIYIADDDDDINNPSIKIKCRGPNPSKQSIDYIFYIS